MSAARSPGLALLFTPGVTLGDWRRAGFLEREVRYYDALSRCVGPVVFVHEGRERGGGTDLGGVGVVDNAAGLPSPLFWTGAALRVTRGARRAGIVKTNQLAGVIPAIVARAAGAHVVARGGWVQTEPWWYPTPRHPRRLVALVREAVLVRMAAFVFVTTAEGASAIERRHRLRPGRIRVLPNFVDVEMFGVARPKVRGLATMVGRLSAQKDPLAAIEAISRVPGATLRVAGDGPLRGAAEEQARRTGARVEFLGAVPHRRLPELLAETEVFLSASRYEGHPKALIEAMAAGVACVARPSPGVASILEHGRTGYLAASASVDALAQGVSEVLGDASLRERIGGGAREAAQRYSLERVVALECEAYRSSGWLS